MVKGLMIKTNAGHYAPCDEVSARWASKDEVGDTRNFTSVDKRNAAFSRKFWAMVNLVAANQERIEFDTAKQGQDRLIYAACHILGLGEFWGKDKQHFERVSFAFHNMDEEAFAECYNQILGCFLKYFVPMDKEQFERELISFG